MGQTRIICFQHLLHSFMFGILGYKSMTVRSFYFAEKKTKNLNSYILLSFSTFSFIFFFIFTHSHEIVRISFYNEKMIVKWFVIVKWLTTGHIGCKWKIKIPVQVAWAKFLFSAAERNKNLKLSISSKEMLPVNHHVFLLPYIQ